MNLIIDVGNSSVKWAVFSEQNMLKRAGSTSEELIPTFNTFLKEYPKISHAILSVVGSFSEATIQYIQERLSLLILDQYTKVPFRNAYKTPETLGVDRLALVSAAATHYPKKNVLVIDAGSCITYDLLTAQNIYLGGAISPGLQMRYRALHTFTAKLPLLEPKHLDAIVGDSTENAMHVGVATAIGNEMDGFVNDFKEKYPDLTVILTGGDAHFLRDSLKNDIFANSNFLLEGLHFILEHNKD